MTVILVLFFFVLFLTIDYIKTRKTITVAVSTSAPRPALPERLVNGFRLPDTLSYHPGHAWAKEESPALVRVGMDDFASKLIGRIDSIVLPQRGTWIRQGQKFATIIRDDKEVGLVSPIEGTVSDVNTDAIRDPEAARKDAYNSGWLMTVDSPDKKTCWRNLLSGNLARLWVEEAAMRLHPAMAQDGGEAIDDFAVAAGKDWKATVKEAFLN